MSGTATGRRDLISIVVPVLNEEAVIPVFLAAVAPFLDDPAVDHEIIFIDDGSTDGTFRAIEAAAADRRVRGLGLSRNFGKEAAVTAGLQAARGDAVVVMDVDLQDPPALIADFIAGWRSGYDVVYGARRDRASDGLMKRWSARWFYWLFNRLSETQIPADAGDYRLMGRPVVDAILRLPERGRFMKGIFAWVGFRALAVPFARPPRVAGATKWRPFRLVSFAFDGIFSFSVVPLRLSLIVGAVMFVLATIYLVFIVSRTLILGIDLPGYASLLCTILAIGGMQMFLFGVFGEYLGRLVIEVKQRPLYVVAREINPPVP